MRSSSTSKLLQSQGAKERWPYHTYSTSTVRWRIWSSVVHFACPPKIMFFIDLLHEPEVIQVNRFSIILVPRSWRKKPPWIQLTYDRNVLSGKRNLDWDEENKLRRESQTRYLEFFCWVWFPPLFSFRFSHDIVGCFPRFCRTLDLFGFFSWKFLHFYDDKVHSSLQTASERLECSYMVYKVLSRRYSITAIFRSVKYMATVRIRMTDRAPGSPLS